MEKRNKIFVGILSLIAIIIFLSYSVKTYASPSNVTPQASASATSTMSFMTPGTATTTYQFDNTALSSGKVPNVGQQDGESLYIQFAASSSASTLAIQLQFSNNGIDWYGYNNPLTTIGSTGYTPLASTTVTWIYAPGAAGTTTQVFNLPYVPAIHERVVFSIPIGAANGAIYNEVDLHRNPQTP